MPFVSTYHKLSEGIDFDIPRNFLMIIFNKIPRYLFNYETFFS